MENNENSGDPLKNAHNEVFDDDNNEREKIEKALGHLCFQDPLTQYNGLELICNNIDKPKGVLKDQLRQLERERIDFEVKKTEKIIPPNPNDDIEYKFYVKVEDENYTFKIQSSDLWTQRVFSTKLLEITNRRIKWKGDEFDRELDRWLTEKPQEVIEESPIDTENMIAHKILAKINSMSPTTDREKATVRDLDYYYLPFKDDSTTFSKKEIWVNSSAIGKIVNDTRKDVKNLRIIRDILEPVLSAKATRRRVDGTDHPRQTFWRFDIEALKRVEDIDIDTLEDREGRDPEGEEVKKLDIGGEHEPEDQ